MKELSAKCGFAVAVFPPGDFQLSTKVDNFCSKVCAIKRREQSLIVHELTIQKVCTVGIRIGFKVIKLIHP